MSLFNDRHYYVLHNMLKNLRTWNAVHHDAQAAGVYDVTEVVSYDELCAALAKALADAAPSDPKFNAAAFTQSCKRKA